LTGPLKTGKLLASNDGLQESALRGLDLACSGHPAMWCPVSPGRHGLTVFLVSLVLLLWMAPPLADYLRNVDHGYQLSLARFITLGAFPFVDLFFHYGPLVAWTSALALWVSGGLIGETLLCATGYAASLTCLAWVGRARLGSLAGWVIPIVALLFLARFYKWYFSFFPAISLVILHRYLEGRPAPDRSLLIGGLSAGLCALFRFDLGIVLLTFWGLVVVTDRTAPSWSGFALRGLRVASGFVLPMLLWLGALAVEGGTDAIRNYGSATFDGGTGVVTGWSHGAAPFDPGAPFSASSGLRLALWILPIGLFAGLGVGGWRSFRLSGRAQSDARFLAGASILGIGLLPQAFYRADGQHLLQSLPPFFVVAPLLVREALREFGRQGSRATRAGRVLIAAVAAVMLVAGIGVSSFGRLDLAPLSSNGFERLRDLARGFGPHDKAIRQITSITPPGSRILVVPMVPQIYYFAERRLSGVLNLYAQHILDDPKWRRLNFEHVRAHPPAAVFVTATWLDASSEEARILRASHPELDVYLRANYTEAAFLGPLRILRPTSAMRSE